jgi:hypothetical protein
MFRALLILCTSAAVLWAQPDFEEILARLMPHVVDPASAGMGRVGLAGPISSNAMFANPSLMALMDSAQASVGGRMHYGFVNDEYMDEYAKMNDQKIEYGYRPSGKFTHASGTVPFIIDLPAFPLSLAAGLGYHNEYDFSFSTFSNSKEDDTKQESVTKYRGGLNVLSIGLGIGLGNYGAFGITFNPSIGSKLRDIYHMDAESDFGDYEYDSKGKTSMKAFFVNLGFSGRPFQNTAAGTMTLGMMVRPGFTVDVDEYEWEEEENDDGTISSDDDEMDLDVEMNVPAIFGFGLHWQVTPVFSWATEIQTRPFDDLEIDDDGDDIKLGLDNGIAFRTGFEVKAGPVPIRAGFFLEHIGLGSDDDSKSSDKLYDEGPEKILGATLGTGIPIKVGCIDIGLTYAFLNKEDRRRNLSAATTTYKNYSYQEHHLFMNAGVSINIPAPRFSTSGSAAQSAPAAAPAAVVPAAPAPAPEPIQQEPAYNAYPATTTPAYDNDSESGAPSAAPSGRTVQITTTSNQVYTGTLVSETDTYYIVDMDGNQVTLYKDVVQSIE